MIHIQRQSFTVEEKGGNKNILYIKSAALQTTTTGSVELTVSRAMRMVRECYLQQASAPREVWLSRLLSVSDVTVGSLLGSVVSVDVDMDETSLAEEEAEEEEVA